MRPDWKEYTCSEWDGAVGISPDHLQRETGRFHFNKNGVCVNPRILGIMDRGWRIGIRTALNPQGRWTHGRDISFPCAGSSCLPWRNDADSFDTEDEAIVAELEYAIRFVTHQADPKAVSMPLSRRDAGILLELLRGKLRELTSPKQPTYTQLELF